MYIDNKWYTEPELNAYVTELIKERDAYKAELIDTLRKSYVSRLEPYAAKLRLEELTGGVTIC